MSTDNMITSLLNESQIQQVNEAQMRVEQVIVSINGLDSISRAQRSALQKVADLLEDLSFEIFNPETAWVYPEED